MTTGQRMKALRKQLDISAETIAEKLGVSPATIYRYEKGDIEKMPGDFLEPIAKILHTTPNYLMGWEEKEITEPETGSDLSLNDQEQAFINWLRSLPEEKRQAVLNFADRF